MNGGKKRYVSHCKPGQSSSKHVPSLSKPAPSLSKPDPYLSKPDYFPYKPAQSPFKPDPSPSAKLSKFQSEHLFPIYSHSLSRSPPLTPSLPITPTPSSSYISSEPPTPISPTPNRSCPSPRILILESPTPEPPETQRTDYVETPTLEFYVAPTEEHEVPPTAEQPLSFSKSDGSTDIEAAVSHLTQFHYQRMSALLARQEEERQRLKLEFEMKQQELIDQIVKQFPNLKLQISAPSSKSRPEKEHSVSPFPEPVPEHSKLEIDSDVYKPVSVHTTEGLGFQQMKPVALQQTEGLNSNTIKPLFEGLASTPSTSKLVKPTTARLISPGAKPDQPPREIIREIQQSQPKNELHIPPDVCSKKYARGWTCLTALARGFLVRRLLRTEKVQNLKQTIRETLQFAIQLHHEGSVKFK